MVHMIGHIFFGLIVGIVAKLLTPGHDPGGIIVTIVLGIVGAWVGGQLGQWLGWYEPGHPAGFLMAVVGAILLLVVYRVALQRSPSTQTLYAPSGAAHSTVTRGNTRGTWLPLPDQNRAASG
jgi:uncharacterized membrane protein YeaQ/YmgE (transglycosylase-associated protein family)